MPSVATCAISLAMDRLARLSPPIRGWRTVPIGIISTKSFWGRHTTKMPQHTSSAGQSRRLPSRIDRPWEWILEDVSAGFLHGRPAHQRLPAYGSASRSVSMWPLQAHAASPSPNEGSMNTMQASGMPNAKSVNEIRCCNAVTSSCVAAFGGAPAPLTVNQLRQRAPKVPLAAKCQVKLVNTP
jgi:hypothetical protein